MRTALLALLTVLALSTAACKTTLPAGSTYYDDSERDRTRDSGS